MSFDPELAALVRTSVQQAFLSSADDIGAALAAFGWAELVETDEAFAYAVLFEEQGRHGADTDALDVVTLAALGVDGPARVLWPLELEVTDVASEGVTLGDVGGRTLVVPAGASLRVLADATVEEQPVGGMAAELSWRRVRVEGDGPTVGSWPEVERRARLALASEIVGVAERMLEVATEQVSERRQFGRPIGTYQAIRHRLAEAYSELAGARSLVTMAWEDGRPDAATWAKTVAGTAHGTVTKHATQVCGAIGLHEEHPLPRLVRRGFALDGLLGSAATARAAMGRHDLTEPLPESVGTF